jgi:signal transduction histidine kinase
MKKLFIKYTIYITAIFIFITAAWIASFYLWAQYKTKEYCSERASHVIGKALPILAENKIHSRNLKETIAPLMNDSEIVCVRIIDRSRVVIFTGLNKPERMKAGLSVHFPIQKGSKNFGWLRVTVAAGFIVRHVMLDSNPNITFWLIGWFLTLILAISVFLARMLYTPLSKLKHFADLIEKESFEPIDPSGSGSTWRGIFTKLNLMNEKLSEANDTLHILFSATQALTSKLEISEIFGNVLEIIQKKFPEVSCSVSMLGDDGFLRIKAQRGVSPDFMKGLQMRPGEGFLGQAYQKCQIVMVNDAETEESPFGAEPIRREGIKSFIHIPLVNDIKCVGILNINSTEKGYFTKERIRSFSTLGEYLSIAVRNVELYGRVQELNERLESEVSTTTRELMQTNSMLIQKVREMKVLSDIAGFAATKVSLPAILEMIVEKIKDLLSAQAAGFFLYSEDMQELIPYPPFFGIRDRDFSRLHFRLDEIKIFNELFTEGKSQLLNEDRQALEALPLLANILAIHSLVLVPLRLGKKNIGIMGVANKFGSPFNQNDVKILELIGDRISGTIENVMLYQEIEHRLHDLTTLQEISSVISSEPVWEQIFRKIVSSTTQSFSADLCAILLYDEKTNELVTQSGAYFTGGYEAVMLSIPVNDQASTTAQVFRSGEAFMSPDASIDPRIKSQTARLWDLRSVLLIPLRAENRVIGVIRIGKHQANYYTKDHMRLATLIAHQAAVIIENAQLYESLRDTKTELENLNRIKNEFISIVSHELRTPITAIKGFVKVILHGDTGKLNPQQEKFLKIVDQSIDRLTLLIAEFLDISRIESGQMNMSLGEVDPKQLVETAVEKFKAEGERKNIKITVKLPDKLPAVNADKERLAQVFDNLISNSVKFTPSGGEITVSAEDKGDYALFKVADNGIGIAAKDHKKIFDKFFQVDSGPARSMPGAGLGLAIAKSIVEMHGGQLWVESELGKGAAFLFVVPRLKSETKDLLKDPKRIEEKK